MDEPDFVRLSRETIWDRETWVSAYRFVVNEWWDRPDEQQQVWDAVMQMAWMHPVQAARMIRSVQACYTART